MTTADFPEVIHDFGEDVSDGVEYHTAEMENDMRAEMTAVQTQAQRTMLLGYFANTETLSGTKTLTDADDPIQVLDPGGASRDVTLPAEADANHLFVIANTADAYEILDVKNDGGDIVGTVRQGETKLFLSNGTTWLMLFEGRTDGYVEKNTETLTGARTLTDADAPIQFLDPGGAAREVTLPAEGSGNHPFIISNQADADETITVKNGSGTTIVEIAQNETKAVYSDGVNWAALSGGGGSGGAGDIVSTLVESEVAITAAATLDSTAFGKMHVITGTSADYTIDLPAVSGNAGKFIGFRVGGEADASKLYTLDGNSAELIDGQATRILWANEVAILECDGTGWVKIAGKSIPMMCRLEYQSATEQNIATATVTTLQFDTEIFDVGGLGDTGNNRINFRRSGLYRVFTQIRWYAATAARSYMNMSYYDASASATVAVMSDERYSEGTAISNLLSTVVNVEAGDYLYNRVYQNSGGARKIYSQSGTEYPSLVVEEIITW